MDKALHDTVLAIAQDVRWWAEGRAEDDTLNGWCAIASAELFKRLQEEGIQAEIRMWMKHREPDSHAFVVVDDHVVDVTATQFEEFEDQPVVIMHECEAMVHEFYNGTKVFTDIEDLRIHQRKNRWPADQIAYAK